MAARPDTGCVVPTVHSVFCNPVIYPVEPSMVTGLPLLPTMTLPSLPLIVTVLSVLPAAPLLKVVSPLAPKATLPDPAVLVILVMLPKSFFNLMFTVVLPSVCFTVVKMLEPSKLVASLSAAPPLMCTVEPSLLVTGLSPPSAMLAPNFIPLSVDSLTAFAILASDVFLRSDTLTAALDFVVSAAASPNFSRNLLSGTFPSGSIAEPTLSTRFAPSVFTFV